MIQTSIEFQNAISSNNRSSVAEIIFGVYDVDSINDAEPSVNTIQTFSSADELALGDRAQQYKMATFEPDFFRLDGSFCLMPDDIDPSTDKMGWWSLAMSTDDKTFSVNPLLTVNFDNLHSSLGIGLFFGNKEYCTDFVISWYKDEDLLDQIDIEGNDTNDYSLYNPVENFNKVTVEFKKTRYAFRYLRLMSIEFGVEERFDNSNLVSASVIEGVDPSGSSISVNKLKFTVINKDQKFNMLNPEGIYAYLQRRQKITAKSGLFLPESGDEEYVSMGTYYLSDWKSSNSLTATLEATDSIGLLDKTVYRSSPFWSDETIENVVTHVLEDAGDFELSILASAASEVINGYIPVKSHREALIDILVATGCYLRMSRNNVIEIGKADYSSPIASIEYELMLGSPTIEQKPLITTVEANDITYRIADDETEISKTTFVLDGTQDIVIDFGKAVYQPSLIVSGDGSLSGSAEFSVVSATATIVGTGELTVTIQGKEYIEDSRIIRVSLAEIPAGEVPQTATISDNKLICGNGNTVANNLLNYFQKRISQSFKFWANPAVQASDYLEVETDYDESFSGIVEKQEIQFSPNLSAKLEVIG